VIADIQTALEERTEECIDQHSGEPFAFGKLHQAMRLAGVGRALQVLEIELNAQLPSGLRERLMRPVNAYACRQACRQVIPPGAGGRRHDALGAQAMPAQGRR